MHTDIFKLIFHHDQRLNKLADDTPAENPKKMNSTLQDFMTPDPTYSRFYFTGTDLANEQFGLNNLSEFDEIILALDTAFNDKNIFTHQDQHASIKEALQNLSIGEATTLTDQEKPELDISSLHLTSDAENAKQKLKNALRNDFIVIYKEQAKDGFDLHMLSKENVYRDMFFPLQKLVPDHFRFFSINGKKFSSERHFYFETWTLDKPPHGFEEVHPESVL